MIFQGYYTNCDERVHMRTDPIFSIDKRIVVFDVEGVLVLSGKNGNGGYKLNRQACCVIDKALSDGNFDEVVFWSTSHRALGMDDFYFCDAHRALQYHLPLSKVHQRIGGSGNDGERIIKDLQILSANLSNVIAIEDDDFFAPESGVTRYKPGMDLMIAYHMAVDKIGRVI